MTNCSRKFHRSYIFGFVQTSVQVKVEKMAKNLVKITIQFISIYQVIQLCQATPRISNLDENLISIPSPENPNLSEANENSTPRAPQSPLNKSDNSFDKISNLTPTDPMDLNKMAFRPLLKLCGKLGPVIYTLLTEKNALGEQMSEVSKLIADGIGLADYAGDMDLILSNAFNPEVSKKAVSVYEKIKDVHVEGTNDRTLGDAMEIIWNILNDDKAVDEINNIIKTSTI